MLRTAKLSDVGRLAELHSSELSTDFLPSLGMPFLVLLYTKLIKSPNIYILVFESTGRVEGFIVGGSNFDKTFKNILSENIIQFSIVITPHVLKKPQIIKKIIETMFYTQKFGSRASSAELVVLAVSKRFQRIGLGRKLVNILERKLKGIGISKYRVSVNAGNAVANSFYKALSFVEYNKFELYGKEINIYIKKLK